MSSPAPLTVTEEFAALLDELGLGDYRPDTIGGDVFLHGLPREPDSAVVVTTVAGPVADGRNGYNEPMVLYRVRGAPGDGVGPERRAWALFDALHGIGKRRLPGGTRLERCFGSQAGPVALGPDEQGRHEWSVTLSTELRRPTLHRR